MSQAIDIIRYYNKLNNNVIGIDKLKEFRDRVQTFIDSHGHGPHIATLKVILTKITKAVKSTIAQKAQLTEIHLTPITEKQPVNGVDSKLEEKEMKAFIKFVHRWKKQITSKWLWQDFEAKQREIFGIETQHLSRFFQKTGDSYKISPIGISYVKQILDYNIDANNKQEVSRLLPTELNGLECGCPEGAGENENVSLGELNNTAYQVITDRILELLNDNGLMWRQPWDVGKANFTTNMAHNYVTKHIYRGGNSYLTWLFLYPFKIIRNGKKETLQYSTPYFFTFKQVTALGGKVKAGERGWPVIYFKWLYSNGTKLVDEKEAKTKEGKLKPGYTRIPGIFYYTVFNYDQTEGVKVKIEKQEPKTEKEKIESAENIVANMPPPPKIERIGADAFYRRADDLVRVPPMEYFKVDQQFYGVLFHELIHSTGHEKRVYREREAGRKFGDKKYAFEELIAELGSSFLCGESGIFYFTMNNSAAYVKNWSQVLRDELKADPKFYFKAAGQAQAAADYILDRKEVVPEASKAKRESRKPVARQERKASGKATAMPSITLPSEQRGKKKLKKGLDPKVKASVAQAIDDLIKAFPEKYAKKAMVMQMLYSKFNNNKEQELEEKSLAYNLLNKENWIDYERTTFSSYKKGNDTAIYSINVEGQQVINAINGRLNSLQIKKQGGELFPNLKGTKGISASNLAGMEFKTLPFDGKWKNHIGTPSENFSAMVWGKPKQGKTHYSFQFANYLSQFGAVLYILSDEGIGYSVKEKIIANGLDKNEKVSFIETRELSEIENAIKSGNYKFVFIDLVSNVKEGEAKLTPAGFHALRKRHSAVSFIPVFSSTKSGNFRGEQDWGHDVDVLVDVAEGVANAQGRFGGGNEYHIFTKKPYKDNKS